MIGHLSHDDIYELAVATNEMDPYSGHQIDMMIHMKECEDCFKIYSATLLNLELIGENGDLFLAGVFGNGTDTSKEVNENSFSKSVICAFDIVRQYVNEKIEAVVEQISSAGSSFNFSQAYVPAFVRGEDEDTGNLIRLEDIDDENSFIIYNAEENELLIQLSINLIGSENVQIYITLRDGTKRVVVLSRKEDVLQGILKDLPEQSFQLFIEKA